MAALTDRIVSGAKVLTLKGLKYLADAIRGELDKKSPIGHVHDASDVSSGTLSSDRLPSIPVSKLPVVPVSKGGSGLTRGPSMLVNLGSSSAESVFKASPRPGVTGVLPIAHGGTGADLTQTDGSFLFVNQGVSPHNVVAVEGQGAMWNGFDNSGAGASGPRAGVLPQAYGGLGVDSSGWEAGSIPCVNASYGPSDKLMMGHVPPGSGLLYMDGASNLPSWQPVVQIENGGTGGSTLEEAQEYLGISNLRDSLSRTVTLRELDTTAAQIGTSYAAAQRVVVAVETDDGRYMLVAADSYLGLYNVTTSSWVWRQNMS